MKSFQEILAGLLETFVAVKIEAAIINVECRENVAPVGIAGKGDDDIEMAVFPEIFESVVLPFDFTGFDLQTIEVRAVGNEDIGLVAIVQFRSVNLPSVVHEPAGYISFE